MRTRETIGSGIFVLGQIIGVGGTAYIAVDSGIPLYEDFSYRDKLNHSSELSSDGIPTPPTEELSQLNEAIENRSSDIVEDLLFISLVAGATTYIGARIALGGPDVKTTHPSSSGSTT